METMAEAVEESIARTRLEPEVTEKTEMTMAEARREHALLWMNNVMRKMARKSEGKETLCQAYKRLAENATPRQKEELLKILRHYRQSRQWTQDGE